MRPNRKVAPGARWPALGPSGGSYDLTLSRRKIGVSR